MPKRFDLIAFDWDGTLFDSTAIIAHSIQAAVRDVGGTVPSDRQATHVIGLGLSQALALAAPDVPRHRYPELAARYRHHYAVKQDEINLFEGVVALLGELRGRDHKLAVATGKSRAGLDFALRAVDLGALFDATRTADQTAGKPDPMMLHELMDELGVDAARTLMVGDTSHDLLMARNAACASVAVSYGAHEAGQFESLGASYTAHSVAQLRHWLIEHA